MSSITLESKRIKGDLTPPPDKSISHRAVIIGSLALGRTRVKNLSPCADCLRTLKAFRQLGVRIRRNKDNFIIQGVGLRGLHRPKSDLYLGNSGTSLRLILGVLAGQNFRCTLRGDASLARRPMQRVSQPLSLMGATFSGNSAGAHTPLTIQGARLRAISYSTKVASAQVKSAILLAALYASGTTQVREPARSRDHTERMLKNFGADISVRGLSVSLTGRANLHSQEIDVPGDISSASFFVVAACLTKNSELILRSVGLNPTRTAFLTVLRQMGARVCFQYQTEEMADADYAGEARGEIRATSSKLRAVTVGQRQIPALIDELPILMVAATQAEGVTVIQGAGELRVKETDRIISMVTNLKKMGADITVDKDDLIIRGPTQLKGTSTVSFGDHRTAMSIAIAGILARGRTTIKDIDCVKVSFPGFFKTLAHLHR